MQQYLVQHEKDMHDDNVTMEYTKEQQAQIYEKKHTHGKSKVRTEENDDWKFVEITPPPKDPISKKEFVAINSLPPYAQKAFTSSSATHLN